MLGSCLECKSGAEQPNLVEVIKVLASVFVFREGLEKIILSRKFKRRFNRDGIKLRAPDWFPSSFDLDREEGVWIRMWDRLFPVEFSDHVLLEFRPKENVGL